jgi:hypothetical protein
MCVLMEMIEDNTSAQQKTPVSGDTRWRTGRLGFVFLRCFSEHCRVYIMQIRFKSGNTHAQCLFSCLKVWLRMGPRVACVNTAWRAAPGKKGSTEPIRVERAIDRARPIRTEGVIDRARPIRT